MRFCRYLIPSLTPPLLLLSSYWCFLSDSIFTLKVAKQCISNLTPSFLQYVLSFYCKEELFLPSHCSVSYLLLSAWNYGFFLQEGGRNIFLSLFILMLKLSHILPFGYKLAHLSLWHAPFSLFSGIGSNHSQLVYRFHQGHCTVLFQATLLTLWSL